MSGNPALLRRGFDPSSPFTILIPEDRRALAMNDRVFPNTTAILDRFLHRAELVQITGKSYRLEKPEKSSKSTKAPTGSPAEE